MNRVLLKIIGSIFFGITLPLFIKEGMFVDGLFYSTISRNLYLGKGSFFKPFFSDTISSEFYAQPPLLFFFQSKIYWLFGDGLWVDKVMCFIIFISIICLIVALFKLVNTYKNNQTIYFLPVLFFMLMEHNYRSYSENLIEVPVTLFSLISIFLMVKYTQKQKYVFLVLASIFISLGFLTKGLVALFPLCFLGFWYLIIDKNWHLALKNTFLILVLTFGILLLVFALNTHALHYLNLYYKSQLEPVLLNVHMDNRVPSRLVFLEILVKELFLGALLIGFLFWFKKCNKIDFKNRRTFFWFLMGLSASLPILISNKQAGYYILPSLPYFALAFALLVENRIQTIKISKNVQIIFSVLLLCSVAVSVFSYGKINSRNQALNEDVRAIKAFVGNQKTIGYRSSDKLNYILPSTLYRFYQINLDTIKSNKNEFVITKNSFEFNNENYKELQVDLNILKVYRIKAGI